MRIDIYASDEAAAFIRREDALAGWQRLYDECAWATSLQSIDFVTIWYEIYKTLFSPLVVAGYDADDNLVGLLTLAVSKEDGTLSAAGANQAEYQAWLATEKYGDEFVARALDRLRQDYPRRRLRFIFLPPCAPLRWLETDPTWSKLCELRSHRRGLMCTTDAEKFRQALKRKGRKSPLRRLEKHGAVHLARLRTDAELAHVFDEIGTHGDARLLAAHNVKPAPDRLKKAFQLKLMRDAPQLVHATVLRVGERIAAANIGLLNRDSVMLGIFTHSPFFAEYSPGKLHVQMLGIELAEANIPLLDLTPGGDYKNRFADSHDEAYILDVFFDRAQFLRHKAKRKVIEAGKRALAATGVSREQAFETFGDTVDKVRRVKAATLPAKVLRRLRRKAHDARELRIYSFAVEGVGELPDVDLMRRDSVEDLLAYKPVEVWQPPAGKFMREALKRLSNGCHVYTRAESGTLLHYGWLIERQNKSRLLEIGQDFYPLADSALLFNYYSHPQARGKGLYRASLCQMLRDAAQIPETKRVYISVLADNHASRHVIEKVGFKYECSFYSQTVLGRIRRWTNAPEEATRPPRDVSENNL